MGKMSLSSLERRIFQWIPNREEKTCSDEDEQKDRYSKHSSSVRISQCKYYHPPEILMSAEQQLP